MQEAIGWLSSGILLITIGQQVYKQWHDRTSKGVSRWLFVGQMLASAGFTLYSCLVHNWVFVVTNGLMLCAAILGFVIKQRHRVASADGPRSGCATEQPRHVHEIFVRRLAGSGFEVSSRRARRDR